MKKHMRVKGSNKMVMFALFAVLLVSLGYLSMQGKEGFKEGADEPEKAPLSTAEKMKKAVAPAVAPPKA